MSQNNHQEKPPQINKRPLPPLPVGENSQASSTSEDKQVEYPRNPAAIKRPHLPLQLTGGTNCPCIFSGIPCRCDKKPISLTMAKNPPGPNKVSALPDTSQIESLPGPSGIQRQPKSSSEVINDDFLYDDSSDEENGGYVPASDFHDYEEVEESHSTNSIYPSLAEETITPATRDEFAQYIPMSSSASPLTLAAYLSRIASSCPEPYDRLTDEIVKTHPSEETRQQIDQRITNSTVDYRTHLDSIVMPTYTNAVMFHHNSKPEEFQTAARILADVEYHHRLNDNLRDAQESLDAAFNHTFVEDVFSSEQQKDMSRAILRKTQITKQLIPSAISACNDIAKELGHGPIQHAKIDENNELVVQGPNASLLSAPIRSVAEGLSPINPSSQPLLDMARASRQPIEVHCSTWRGRGSGRPTDDPEFTSCPCHSSEVRNLRNTFHVEIVLYCNICKIHFGSFRCYENHIERKHLLMRTSIQAIYHKEVIMLCTTCYIYLNTIEDLYVHFSFHARTRNEYEVVILCNLCKVIFACSIDLFISHWMFHKNFEINSHWTRLIPTKGVNLTLTPYPHICSTEKTYVVISNTLCFSCFYTDSRKDKNHMKKKTSFWKRF